MPHRSALPRGRDQRRVPVPARPRGRGGDRRDRRGCHERRARRLRRVELAGRVRRVPVVSPGPAVALLRHAQREAEDDAHRRHTTVARAGYRRVRREDARGGGSGHEGEPRRPPRGRGPARLRRDGRVRRRDDHGQRRPGRHRRGVRLRRRGRRRDRGRVSRRRAHDHRRRPRRQEAGVGEGIRRDPHRRRVEGGPGRGDPSADRRQRRGRHASRPSAGRKC